MTRASGPRAFRWWRICSNPHAPAVHMNTRMFWTPHAWWFGGGSDLNPCIEYDEDTAHFHAVAEGAFGSQHGAPITPSSRPGPTSISSCRIAVARAVSGGYSWMITTRGDWEADFALTQDMGRAFLPAYRAAGRKASRAAIGSEADKDAQLVHRGSLCGIQSGL